MAGVKVTIGANARALRRTLTGASRFMKRWARGLARIGRSAGRMMINGIRRGIQAGAGALAGASAFVGKSLFESGRFETYEVQFEALLKSATKAKDRMEEIKAIDLEVPFDITSIANASRVLTVFTDDAFAGADALRVMADAAAVTPNEIEDVAFWFGRAYSMIQAGRPFGEAAMRLQEMGLLSGQARNEIEKFSGVRTPYAIAKSMEILLGEFKKFDGAAAKRAKTWAGLMSIFTSETKQDFKAIGDSIMPVAKVYLQEIIDKLKEMRSSGRLADIGRRLADGIELARDAIQGILPSIQAAFTNAKVYVTAFYNDIRARDFGSAVADRIEPAIETAVSSTAKTIEKYAPDFAKSGFKIGVAIGKGIAGGLRETLADFWEGGDWWMPTKQIAEAGKFLGTQVEKNEMRKRQYSSATKNGVNPYLAMKSPTRGISAEAWSRASMLERAKYGPTDVRIINPQDIVKPEQSLGGF